MKKISIILAVTLTIVAALTISAAAFSADNYKANINKISIGAPITNSETGKKYLPVTVFFTANEDLSDMSVEALEGYLRATLANGLKSEGINGLGMTLRGPFKPDVPLSSNMFTWEWSDGKGLGMLKYDIPLLEKDDTQTIEKSQATNQMEVNGLKVGDQVTMQIETVFNSSIPQEVIPDGNPISNEATFTIEEAGSYPKEITVQSGGGSQGDIPVVTEQPVNQTPQVSQTVPESQDLIGLKGVSVKKGKKSFTIKWKKPSKKIIRTYSGYEVQYTLDGSFTDFAPKKVGKNKTSVKIKGLQSKRKYIVRVRAFRNDGSAVHVTSWKVKTVKVK